MNLYTNIKSQTSQTRKYRKEWSIEGIAKAQWGQWHKGSLSLLQDRPISPCVFVCVCVCVFVCVYGCVCVFVYLNW